MRMQVSEWDHWRWQAEQREREREIARNRKRGHRIEIRIGPIEIGCKWVSAWDERFERCIYHGELRRKGD